MCVSEQLVGVWVAGERDLRGYFLVLSIPMVAAVG